MSAYTNKLKYHFNFEEIDKKYIIVQVFSSSKMKPSLLFLDSVLENKGIVSLCYTEFSEVFVLLDNIDNIIYSFTNSLSVSDNDLSYKKVSSRVLQPHVLIQLFINSLARSKLSSFSYNNLAGHLYVVVDPEDKNKKQIKTIEIKMDKDCCLQAPVRTFTSKQLEKFIEFNKGKSFNSYPQYVFASSKHLKRTTKPEKNSFILRQIRGKKSEVKFLNFQNIEKFNQSKCGIIQNVMEQFFSRYNDIIQLNFEEISSAIITEHKSSMLKTEKTIIMNAFKQIPVRIVDFVDNDLSKELVEILKMVFAEDEIDIKQGKYLKNNYYNICIIHEKEKYEPENDPHDKIEASGPNQCITIETYMDFANNKTVYDQLKNIKNTVVHELLIKKDINDKKITTFDWQSMGYLGEWTFVEKYKLGEETKFCCMKIQQDGSFGFEKHDYNLFSEPYYRKYEEAFNTDKNAVGVIEDWSGNINCIVDTNMFTIPDLKGIKNELINNNNKLKNKKMREDLLSASLDINYYTDGSDTCYYVGIAQDKIMYSSNNSALIRRIKPAEGSSIFFGELLDLMNVTFVKNGQLTVTPFPYKYIREYIINNK